MINKNNPKKTTVRNKSASSVSEDIVRKYIDLFDRLPIGIYRTTPEGKILTANPAFLNLLGYSDMEDLEGIDLNKTHKSPDARNTFRREIEEKGEIFAKESILKSREGKYIIVEEYAKVHKNDNGDVLFYEGIVIDSTLKKHNEERIYFLSRLKELILNISTSFVNIRLSDIDDQIVFSLKSIGHFIGADRSYVFLFDDPDMQTMSNTHESVSEDISSVMAELQELPASKFPWWLDNLKKNKPIIIPDIDDLPDEAASEKKLFKHQHIKSLFAVPMFFEYRLIGFLGFDMVKRFKVVDDEILELLNIAASLFANILNYQKTEYEIIEYRQKLEKMVDQRTQELETLNEQLRIIADSSNDVIWTMDTNLRTTFMSPSVFQHLGYRPEEYMALPLEKRMPAESINKVKQIFKDVKTRFENGEKIDSQELLVFEILHQCKNGEKIWGEVSFSLLADDKGEIVGVHGITRNIHNRKLAEIALWESNQRLKSLVENTTDWIWEVDTKGIYTYSSPMCETILGFKPEETMGKSFADFLDPEARENSVRYFKNTLNTRKPFKNFENIAIHKNGRKVYLETSGVPIFDINGKFKGYRGIDRDITEKKQFESVMRNSQFKHSQHMRNTMLAYIEWDSNFEVIEWNAAAKKLFGFNKSQAMVENILGKLLAPAKKEKTIADFHRTLKSGKATRLITQCITNLGKEINCEWNNTPLADGSGNPIGMASLVRLAE